MTTAVEEVGLETEAPSGPVRTCVGCRSRRDQRDLIRFVRTPGGIRCIATGRRPPGRGAALCPEESCIAAAARRDGAALRHALRGGTATEATAALRVARTPAVRELVRRGTVRSENA